MALRLRDGEEMLGRSNESWRRGGRGGRGDADLKPEALLGFNLLGRLAESSCTMRVLLQALKLGRSDAQPAETPAFFGHSPSFHDLCSVSPAAGCQTWL